MSLPPSAIDEAAALLRTALATREPIAPLRGIYPAADIRDAYAIQEVNTGHRLAAGARLSGRKIGLTSLAVQQQMKVDQPDFGMLFDDMAVTDGVADYGRLVQPRVEAEIVFLLGRDLSGDDLDEARVAAAIEVAIPALEIVDSRIRDWDIAIVDTVADNASSGLFVLGDARKRLAEIDVVGCTMSMRKNGEESSKGTGAACLGSPLKAVLWLARKMVAVGRPLSAGDIVLSGALGPIVRASPGDQFEAEISGLGRVSVGFSKGG